MTAPLDREPRRREVIIVRSDYGLPYSKGLMAQSIMATGLPPERSFALARMIEDRLLERDQEEVDIAALRELAEEVLRAEEGTQAITRYRQWWRLGTLDRPLVVLLGGVTGVGKSTVASQLANRLGITSVVATDQVRQVVRAFFSPKFLPSVHHSSFDVGRALEELGKDGSSTVGGFLRQVADVAPGVDALVERSVSERNRIVLEGVHLLPDVPDPELCREAITVRALLTVEDEESHRAHFYMRGLQQPRPPGRYLEAFDRIRELQEYLVERARRAGIVTIDEGGLESTLKRVMELVLDAVGPPDDGDVPPKQPSASSKAPGNVQQI